MNQNEISKCEKLDRNIKKDSQVMEVVGVDAVRQGLTRGNWESLTSSREIERLDFARSSFTLRSRYHQLVSLFSSRLPNHYADDLQPFKRGWTSLASGPRYKVKVAVVGVHGICDLQMHRARCVRNWRMRTMSRLVVRRSVSRKSLPRSSLVTGKPL